MIPFPGKPVLALRWLMLLLVLWQPLSGVAQVEDAAPVPDALWVLGLDGVVGPATADYVTRGLERAAQSNARAVLLTINTPGGLDSSMRQMISAVLAAPIPVLCYVSPGGARAASAGTYLLYSCHVAAMAPATNLGAATPVAIGTPMSPEPEGADPATDKSRPQQSGSAMERKVTNDAVAYIRSLAELRGRNADWAERAVREGASLSATQALEQDVIDLIALDVDDLLKQLDGEKVQVGSREITLQLTEQPRVTYVPDWRSEFLAVITNPNVAYILMLIGVYGLIFEFSNPGFGVPGVLGAICLLVALYAFQVLPVSYAGLGLMLLGIGLIVAEVFMPSFGILGIGGIVAFVVGSIILMDTELAAYQIALPVIIGLAVTTGLLVFAVIGMALRAHQRPRASGLEMAWGLELQVENVNQGQALVRFDGELWPVRCEVPLAVGDRVQVRASKGNNLLVDKLEE